jgi:hypothetical protein
MGPPVHSAFSEIASEFTAQLMFEAVQFDLDSPLGQSSDIGENLRCPDRAV